MNQQENTLLFLISRYWVPPHTLQYSKVRGGAHYHSSVGICENGYPFAHIPTVKCEDGPIIIYQ